MASKYLYILGFVRCEIQGIFVFFLRELYSTMYSRYYDLRTQTRLSYLVTESYIPVREWFSRKSLKVYYLTFTIHDLFAKANIDHVICTHEYMIK